jgi:hypothetical protein
LKEKSEEAGSRREERYKESIYEADGQAHTRNISRRRRELVESGLHVNMEDERGTRGNTRENEGRLTWLCLWKSQWITGKLEELDGRL